MEHRLCCQVEWHVGCTAECVFIHGLAAVGQLDLPGKPTPLAPPAAATESTSDWFEKSSLLDVLTPDDLKLIQMTPDGAKLAARIGRDRANGTLSGPVNRDYLESVIQSQVEDLNAAEPEVPYVVLHNAEREALILSGFKYPPPLLKDTGTPGVYSADGEAGNLVCIREALTNSDKKLLMSMNGGTLSGGSDDFSHLMTTIALDRATGNLQGEMTRDYLTNLISQAERDLAINPQQAPGISVGFLEKALAAYDALRATAASRTSESDCGLTNDNL